MKIPSEVEVLLALTMLPAVAELEAEAAEEVAEAEAETASLSSRRETDHTVSFNVPSLFAIKTDIEMNSRRLRNRPREPIVDHHHSSIPFRLSSDILHLKHMISFR